MNIGTLIIQWYQINARDLPWRQTKEPYFIWVSEIIMQQTRIEQGLPYYLLFIDQFTSVKALATANEDDVLRAWQGLGYYSRARNMHATAKQIMNEFGGVFPTKAEDLIKLKGIGKYTAAAISSFCYNENIAAIDGNVTRVIARLFGIKEPTNKTTTTKQIEKLSNELVKTVDANDYNQAMMDLGATICTPSKPDCSLCPVNGYCKAFEMKITADIPTKENKIKIKERYFTYLLIKSNTKVLIKKRTGNDIWKGLHEFVLIETRSKVKTNNLLSHKEVKKFLDTINDANISFSEKKPHKLSHQTLHTQLITITCKKLPKLKDYTDFKIEHLDSIAFPKLLQADVQNLLSPIS